MDKNIYSSENEGVYQAKMYGFWKNYNKAIITFVVFVIISIVSFFLYKSYQDDVVQEKLAKLENISSNDFPIFEVVEMISAEDAGIAYLATTSAFKYYSENSKYNDATKILNVFLSFHGKGVLAHFVKVRLHLFDNKEDLIKLDDNKLIATTNLINLETNLKNKDYNAAILNVENILKFKSLPAELRSKIFVLKEELSSMVKK